jgi:oligosaccharyltransferase complex subunit gamma
LLLPGPFEQDANLNANRPQSAEQVYSWILRHAEAGPHPRIVRPINYVRVIAIITIGLGLVTLMTVASPYILPIIQNRNLWAAVSLIAILLFTSGHMYNHIRGVPYVAGDGKGGISYFAGGFSNQFGMETQIVAAMCKWAITQLNRFRTMELGTDVTLILDALLSFATISLALKVPRMADPGRQQIAIWIWGSVILCTYSFLLSVFRIKNGGYPFWLPPFN